MNYRYIVLNRIFMFQSVTHLKGSLYELTAMPCPGFAFQLQNRNTEDLSRYIIDNKKEFPLLYCTSPWPLIKKFHISLIYFKFLYHFPPEIYTKWQTTYRSMRWPTTCFWRTVKALTRSQRNPQYGFFCGLAKSS